MPGEEACVDAESSNASTRIVRVWTKTETDGRLRDGEPPWEARLSATPEIRLVPGDGAFDGNEANANASAFDRIAFFEFLKTKREGRVLYTALEVESTQSVLQQNLGSQPGRASNDAATSRGATFPAGSVVVADKQVSGRGRGGNSWTSPPGCLMFSFLTEHHEGRTLPFVQYVATMAAVDAIQECADEALDAAAAELAAAARTPDRVAPLRFRRGTGSAVDVRVKWPNDVYSGGHKIGGVLCTSTYDDGVFEVVIGVGLNLDNRDPTTCVNAIVSRKWDALVSEAAGVDDFAVAPKPTTRERLAATFMNRFEALCGLMNETGGFEALEPAYLRQWLHSEQRVVLEEDGGVKAEVTVRGLTKTGYLLATDGAGQRYELHPDGNSFDFFEGLVRKKLPR